MSWDYGYWPRPKTVAERRADVAKAVAKAGKKGHAFAPIVLQGRKIARTFWGDAWCKNLERYQDYAYRLDRGRSYLRSGAVIDLQIAAGRVEARVVGSGVTPYHVEIAIAAVAAPAWTAIQHDCAGSIGSLVDLLAGKLSDAVMARLCAEGTGLFPAPPAITFTCSCPDWASMCKHVAAAMYGIGARLDTTPELLFTLRKVTADELLASATRVLPAAGAPKSGRVLADDDLGALFGIDIAPTSGVEAKAVRVKKPKIKVATPTKKPKTKVADAKAASTSKWSRAQVAALAKKARGRRS